MYVIKKFKNKNRKKNQKITPIHYELKCDKNNKKKKLY